MEHRLETNESTVEHNHEPSTLYQTKLYCQLGQALDGYFFRLCVFQVILGPYYQFGCLPLTTSKAIKEKLKLHHQISFWSSPFHHFYSDTTRFSFRHHLSQFVVNACPENDTIYRTSLYRVSFILIKTIISINSTKTTGRTQKTKFARIPMNSFLV